MKRNIIYCLLFLASAASSPATADPKDPRGAPAFYDKNFAQSPIKKEEPNRRSGSGEDEEPVEVSGSAILGLHERYKQELEKQNSSGKQPKEEESKSEATSDDQAKAPSEKESDLFGDEPGVPVLAIGAIINSIDIKHFRQKVSELASVARKHDLEMSHVYAVGDWDTMMQNLRLLTKVMARKGQISTVREVPKQFDITLSPTWIIETAEGDIVVEGLEPLGKFFNKKGEFVESKLRDIVVEQTPPPTPATSPIS